LVWWWRVWDSIPCATPITASLFATSVNIFNCYAEGSQTFIRSAPRKTFYRFHAPISEQTQTDLT
jgi:hypothetical protein